MITLNNESLVITMQEPEPVQRREQLIKAIAAAMRWKATSDRCGASYKADAENQYVISQLLEELVREE